MIFNTILIFSVLLAGIIFINKRVSKTKKEKVYLFIVFTVLIFISGLRSYSVGVDTYGYVNFFNDVVAIPLSSLHTHHLESTYVYFLKLISIFTHNPQAFLLITSLLIYVGIAKLIYNNSNDVVASTAIFISLFFTSTLNISRQYISVAIGCNSITYAKKGRHKTALALIGLSMLFHTAGFINLIVYIIFLLREKKYFFTLMIASSLSIFFIINSKIFYKISGFFGYQHYLNSIHMTESITSDLLGRIYVILIIGSFFIYYLKRNQMELRNKVNEINDIRFYLGIMMLGTSFTLLSSDFRLLSRVGVYFTIYLIVLIPAVMNLLKSKSNYPIYIIVMCIFYISMFLATYRTSIGYLYEFFT